ncbi:hypothetical protein JCM10450v2_003833 [Rhodotorula kratochvilovae]
MKLEPTPLPTPSPSPPLRTLALPSTAATQRASLAEREKHISDARAAAEQARMLYLAKAMHESAQTQTQAAPSASVRMARYSFEVEQSEGGKKVMKKVTVIVPELPKGQQREIRRPRPTSALVFLPPHARRAPAVSAAPLPSRRLSLPALSNLSLLPPPPPIQPFHSLAGTRRPPPAQPVEQRRRAALSLRAVAAEAPNPQLPAQQQGMERVAAWARDQRARLVRGREGDEEEAEREGRGAKRSRGESLSERRGRRVQPLRLV